jgi:alpha-D-ribose 1-methylphosphonate 5-triphosphate synthase subunit PhnH
MRLTIAQLKENRFDFVHDSQQTFRTIMMALAFPGIIRRLDLVSLSFPKPDISYILQPFLTLLDLETTFCAVCDDAKLRDEITRYIELNTNGRPRNLSRADFVLCLETSLNGHFPQLNKGTLTKPDKGATVFYLVDSLSEMPATGFLKLILRGPGIKEVQSVHVSGLEAGEIEQWIQDKYEYPMGIDIYLVSRSGQVIGIPRSVKLEKSGGS